ncbi:hypothetical protein CMI37_25225 [Candidatus Pacearchaeota archaeon]|nr:hypothetical protein [Candidatus Pacearchaeota archaeon]|tara:strand:+ start:566 stop:937 length:372 start_codon:yes stop_codon:yes gene_type:complete
MSLAKQINQKLDEILSLRKEMSQMDGELKEGAILKNKQTGDNLSKEDALKCIEGVIDRLKDDLDKMTNEGQNVQNLFDNPYYVNDMMQDKIANQESTNKIQDNFSQEINENLSGIKKSPNIED